MMPGTGLARDMSAAMRIAWERPAEPHRFHYVAAIRRGLSDLALGDQFGELRGGHVDIDRIGVNLHRSHSTRTERQALLWSTCRPLRTELI